MCFVFRITVFEVSEHFRFLKYCHASPPKNRHFYFAVVKKLKYHELQKGLKLQKCLHAWLSTLDKIPHEGHTFCASDVSLGCLA